MQLYIVVTEADVNVKISLVVVTAVVDAVTIWVWMLRKEVQNDSARYACKRPITSNTSTALQTADSLIYRVRSSREGLAMTWVNVVATTNTNHNVSAASGLQIEELHSRYLIVQ